MGCLYALIVALLIGLGFTALNGIRYERDHPCIKSHVETRQAKERTTYKLENRALVPVKYPAQDYQVEVCDERK